MFRKLAAVLGDPDVGCAIALATVGIALSYLQGYVADRQKLLAALDKRIAERVAELTPSEPYPGHADVDPLDRAAAAAVE